MNTSTNNSSQQFKIFTSIFQVVDDVKKIKAASVQSVPAATTVKTQQLLKSLPLKNKPETKTTTKFLASGLDSDSEDVAPGFGQGGSKFLKKKKALPEKEPVKEPEPIKKGEQLFKITFVIICIFLKQI